MNPRHVEYDSTVLTTKLPRQHNHQLVAVTSVTIHTSLINIHTSPVYIAGDVNRRCMDVDKRCQQLQTALRGIQK